MRPTRLQRFRCRDLRLRLRRPHGLARRRGRRGPSVHLRPLPTPRHLDDGAAGMAAPRSTLVGHAAVPGRTGLIDQLRRLPASRAGARGSSGGADGRLMRLQTEPTVAYMTGKFTVERNGWMCCSIDGFAGIGIAQVEVHDSDESLDGRTTRLSGCSSPQPETQLEQPWSYWIARTERSSASLSRWNATTACNERLSPARPRRRGESFCREVATHRSRGIS